MAQGQSRNAIGVTEAMIESYGDLIFRLSNNYQKRRGDPIRLLDFAAIAEQKPALGMSDREIAARIGLSKMQVLFIRTLLEHRRFRTGHYHRLNKLGGGRRWRSDRMQPDLNHFAYSENALRLRAAFQFPAENVARYVADNWWQGHTLSRWTEDISTRFPKHPAFEDGPAVVSYSELSQRVECLSAGLLDLGLRRGDVVAVQLPNDRRYLEIYLAVAAIGAVMTTLYLPHRRHEMATLLKHSGARAFVGLPQLGDFNPLATVNALAEELPNLAFLVDAEGSGQEVSADLNIVGFDALAEARELNFIRTEPVAADPLLLLYTSGTTAAPKGVPHNSHTLLSNAWYGKDAHCISAQDRLLSAAPFGHLFALYSVHLSLAAGATQLFLPQFSPPDLAAAVAEMRPTVLFAAPAHMAASLNAGLINPDAWQSLRLIILSGSALPAELAKKIQEVLPEADICQLWGMTETQAGLYTRPGDGIDIAARSAGRPSPGTDVRVVGPRAGELPAGQEGELQVRGPLLFPGYLDNEEANKAAMTEDGWFRTGDLATIDSEGYVSITGRSKDVINRGGVKFNPADIEAAVEEHPQILQAAIVAIPDSVLGERACLVVTAADSTQLSLVEMQAFLQSKEIAKQKWPEVIVYVDAMPLTPTRKVIKGKLREQVRGLIAPDDIVG